MIKPLFAVAKNLERALSHAETAGATDLHVPSPSDFSVGAPIFVSEANGAEMEFLGRIRAIGDDTISVAFGLAADKSATAKIWTPSSAFPWEAVTSQPMERSFHEGIRVEQSVGGALWSVRTAEPLRTDRLRFREISRSHFAAFRSWLSAQVRGGLDDFTWVDEERNVARVRLVRCDFTQVEERPRVVELIVDLAVLEEGGYA